MCCGLWVVTCRGYFCHFLVNIRPLQVYLYCLTQFFMVYKMAVFTSLHLCVSLLITLWTHLVLVTLKIKDKNLICYSTAMQLACLTSHISFRNSAINLQPSTTHDKQLGTSYHHGKCTFTVVSTASTPVYHYYISLSDMHKAHGNLTIIMKRPIDIKRRITCINMHTGQYQIICSLGRNP